MNAWPQTAAVLITGCGLISAGAAYRLMNAIRPALVVLLDFLTGAGLIRLAGDPSWAGIALAAGVIVLRKLLGAGLGLSRSNL